MQLHVQREWRSSRRRRGAADGEVDAVAEIRAQRLEVWAQVRRVQALTCMRKPYISYQLQTDPLQYTVTW